jgi:hypothetical protein
VVRRAAHALHGAHGGHAKHVHHAAHGGRRLQEATPGWHEHCTVAAGTFAIVVQAVLGASVLFTLVYKRFREQPKRQWNIWAMDTSKQAFAMSLQHGVNVLLAVLFAREAGQMVAGECIWYITNFTITVACGLVILTFYMKLHNHLVDKYELTWLKSGEYGDPPSICRWMVQMLHWGVVCCAEKFISAAFVIYPLRHHIDALIAKAEAPFLPYPHVELVLVMVVAPAVLNSIFAWIVDNLIKDKELHPKFEEDAPVTVDFEEEEETSMVGTERDLE